MTSHSREEQRIEAAYERRAREVPPDRYSLDRPESIHIRARQLDALSAALRREGLLPLTSKKILEVGCGTGQWLVDFETIGADRSRLAGIDLDAGRLDRARRRLADWRDDRGTLLAAGADLRVGSAAELPWPDRSFDIVFQSTVFTSILDDALKRAVAAEMARVLAPDGAIVWYDFHANNPFNKDVRGVKRSEIAMLFPGFELRLRRVTLLPPIGRRLSPLLVSLLEGLRVLNTHYLGTLRRRS